MSEWETMSLKTISNEESRGYRGKLNFFRETNSLEGIDGCSTFSKSAKYSLKKPDFYNTFDIPGTTSRTQCPKLNKPCFINRVDDIPGARPRCTDFKTKRNVDPLNPDYKLPSYTIAPIPKPRFIRDSYNIDDIEKARPSPLYPNKQRDFHNVNDIEGAQADYKPRNKIRHDPPRDIINVHDINGGDWHTTRSVNPLSPEYIVGGLEIKDDEKTHPWTGFKAMNKPDMRYTTSDIDGSYAPWKPYYNLGGITEEKRRDFKKTNYVGDIPKSCSLEKKYRLETNRFVDPIDPKYIGLDGVPLEDALESIRPPNSLNVPEVVTVSKVIKEKEGHILRLQDELREMKERRSTQREVQRPFSTIKINNNTSTNQAIVESVVALPDSIIPENSGSKISYK